VNFTDVTLNDGPVFDSSKFSPKQSGYFWLEVSAVGYYTQSLPLAMVYTATDVSNITQISLDVRNAAHSWCISFVDISYIDNGDEAFLATTNVTDFSTLASEIERNQSYAFIGFHLDSIMKYPTFAVRSDFREESFTTTTFQSGIYATATENIAAVFRLNPTESCASCSADCVKSKQNIIPQKAGWYLISISVHCRTNVSSSNHNSERRYRCNGLFKGFYSNNSSMWSDTREKLLPIAGVSVLKDRGHTDLEKDLVASSSALIVLHPCDCLHPYYETTTSIVLFSVRALLYEPAHSYKAAWSVFCVSNKTFSTSNTDTSSYCGFATNNFRSLRDDSALFSPHAENVVYDPVSMAVQLDISGIYYIAFTAIFESDEYSSCSVVQRTQNNTKSVLDYTYQNSFFTSAVRVSIQRSRLLLVRENASLICKASFTHQAFNECLIDFHPTFHGFLLYPV
jgi:hypothetical protein